MTFLDVGSTEWGKSSFKKLLKKIYNIASLQHKSFFQSKKIMEKTAPPFPCQVVQ